MNDSTAPSPYEQLGGEPAVRRLADAFYLRMDSEPAYAGIRAMHVDLPRARDRLYWFLCGWLGGPQHYVERFGHPRLRARHLPFAIGVAERDQWLSCMAQAMQDCGVPEALRAQLSRALSTTADWMRNQSD